MSKFININSTKVPNPGAMKFVVENLLLTRGAYEYASAEEAKASPLASKLFNFTYVSRVFIAKNFVTVHKKEESGLHWEEVQSDLRIMIKKHLEFGEPIFDFDSRQMPESPQLDPVSQRISDVIGEAILPATWQDGGEITFESFADGVVTVKLAGACVECPFAPRTLKHGVEKVLKDTFPDEVKEVTSNHVNWEETQQE